MVKWHRTIHTPYSNVSFLVLILYYNSLRYNHVGKLGEGHTGPFCVIFIASSKYNYFKIKGSNKPIHHCQLHTEF